MRPARWLCLIAGLMLGCGANPTTPDPTTPDPIAPVPPPATEPAPAAFDPGAAWQEFEAELRLRYAYVDRDDFDVDAQLARSRTLAEAAPDIAAFRRILQRTGFAFTDPHITIGPLAEDDPNVIFSSSDLWVAVVDGAVRVVDVRAEAAADAAGVRPGWTVVRIDDRPAIDAARAILGDVVPAPTARQLDYAANLAVNGRRMQPRTLVFADGDREVPLTLPSPRIFSMALNDAPPLSTRRVGTVGVIRINNRLGDRALITAFDEAVTALADTTGLIIDLRNTPSGGNTDVARAMIGRFITEIRPYQTHTVPVVERRTTVPRRFVEQVEPRAPHYARPVVVLAGKWTGSMGEGLVIGLDAAADAHSITSDMGDLLGAMHRFDLERSGLNVSLAYEALFHVNGTPREDFVARQPLPAADRDPDGGDPALAAALAHLGVSTP